MINKFIILVISFMLTSCDVRESSYTAKVVDKTYHPSTSSVGSGYSNGKVIVTSNYTPEKYILIITRDDNSETKSIEVDAKTWGKAEKNSKINLTETLYFK